MTRLGAVGTVGQPERATQNRVIALFRDALRYLGDWTGRLGNSNIEGNLVSAWLTTRGYAPEQIAVAFHKLRIEADNHSKPFNYIVRQALMKVLYTQGVWRVKPGHADAFVSAWTEFAEWTSREVKGAGSGKLLRDLNDHNRFVSFGPWDNLAAIEAWRELDGWKERVARIRELLDGFEASTLELMVEPE